MAKINKDDIVGEIDIKKGVVNKGSVSTIRNVYDLVKQNQDKNYSFVMNLNKITAPVTKGDVVGSMEIIDDSGKVIDIVEVVINESIDKHNFFTLFIENFKNIINGYL